MLLFVVEHICMPQSIVQILWFEQWLSKMCCQEYAMVQSDFNQQNQGERVTRITNAEAIADWAKIPYELITGFGDEGDLVRKHLLNPALFGLLGDVRDRRVLDAGCGQGYLSRMLAARGALVTGVEPSDGFFSYARQREQQEQRGIAYIQADLSIWAAPSDHFDCVIANMVLMDIPEYEQALTTCAHALKPGGQLIYSILHPCFEEPGSVWKSQGYVAVRDYFQERAVKQTYGYYIHRTLSTYLNAVIQAGCIIQQVIEPQLEPDVAAQHDAERYSLVPGYIIIAALKPPLG
jgi:2-polyprenyl-3-methyl-5-hydroxy-6-metoxy-1,4-benzoquinol methylase